MDTATCCISDAAAGVAAAFRYKEKGSSLARTKVETCLRGDWFYTFRFVVHSLVQI